jgi:chromosome segregation ATPase
MAFTKLDNPRTSEARPEGESPDRYTAATVKLKAKVNLLLTLLSDAKQEMEGQGDRLRAELQGRKNDIDQLHAELLRRDNDIYQMRAAIQHRDDDLAQLRKELSLLDQLRAELQHREGEVDRLQMDLQRCDADVGRLQTELQARNDDLDRLNKEFGNIAAQLRSAELHRDQAVNERALVLNSTSWRVTTPLRAVARLVRRTPVPRK